MGTFVLSTLPPEDTSYDRPPQFTSKSIRARNPSEGIRTEFKQILNV